MYQMNYNFVYTKNIMVFTGITWIPATHGIHDYVMDSDSDNMRCSSFSFSLVANIYVIFNPHEMFLTIRPKNLSGGMCDVVFFLIILIENLMF